jgi:4-amino-4-deoxy-L-arabinose transferase-like glycosyltransferase
MAVVDEMHSNRPLVGILFVGGLTILAIGQFISQTLFPDFRTAVFVISVIGALFVVLGFLVFQYGHLPKKTAEYIARLGVWFDVADWQVIAFLQGIVFAFIVPFAAGEAGTMRSSTVAILSWCLAVSLAILAGLKPKHVDYRAASPVLAVVLIFFLIALSIRGFATTDFPYVLTGDEGSAGIEAARYAHNEINNIFIAGWYEFPSFFFVLPGLAIRLFGQTTFALRFISALAGALTVACVYVVARAMFGQRTAIFAGIFLTGFHFHNHFSRIGLNNIWDGLWYTVVIGAMWYAWEKERRNAYLLAGLGLGLSQYFYTSARSLWLLIVIWIIIASLLDRARFKRALPSIILMIVVGVITLVPLIWFYGRHPDTFRAPMMRVTLNSEWLKSSMEITGKTSWQIILDQLKLGFGAYFIEPLRHWYTPGIPMLRPFPATFFIIGLILLFLRYRGSRFWLLVLWLAAFGMVGALSESTPAAQRYVAAVPACAIIAGLGLHGSFEVVEKMWPKFGKYIVYASFIVAVLISLDDLSFYFLKYTPRFKSETIHDNTTIANGLAAYLKDKSPEWQVVFFGSPAMGFLSIPSTQYLAPQISNSIDINQPWGSPENPQPTGHHLIFIFLPNHQEDLAAAKATYPGGKEITWRAADRTPLFWAYEYIFAP